MKMHDANLSWMRALIWVYPMLETTSGLERGFWESGDGVTVEYSLDVLDEVRRLAVDGFNAFVHGGQETGGVLYGTREAGCIKVLSCAELPCEHALGPRFVLSEKDHEALAGRCSRGTDTR